MVTPQWAMIFWGYRAGMHSMRLRNCTTTTNHQPPFRPFVPPASGMLMRIPLAFDSPAFEGYDAYGPDDGRWQWQRSALAGLTAGMACSLVYCPLQAVKCTSQVQRCTPRDAVVQLWKFGGLRRGLYRGYLPALAYELPGFAVFFAVFDGLVHWFDRNGSDALPGTATGLEENQLSKIIAAAAAASFAESTVGMPGDTIRTRYQTDLSSPSVRACARDLLRKEGVRGFYRGYRYERKSTRIRLADHKRGIGGALMWPSLLSG